MLEKELLASDEDRAELQSKVSEVTQKHAAFKQQLQEKVNLLRNEVAMKQQEYHEKEKRTQARNQELVRENDRLRNEVRMLRQEIGLKPAPDVLSTQGIQLQKEQASEPKTTGRLSVNRSVSSQKQRLLTESTPKMKKINKSNSQLQMDGGRPPAKQAQRGGAQNVMVRRIMVEGGPSSDRHSTNSSHMHSHRHLQKKERPTSPLRNHHKEYIESRKSSEPKGQKRQDSGRYSTAQGKNPTSKSKVKPVNSEAKLISINTSSKDNSISKGASFSRSPNDNQQHYHTIGSKTAQTKV